MAKTETAKATPKKAGKYSTIIKELSALSYEDRKALLTEVNKAHAADTDQFSLGQQPSGAGYMTMEDNLHQQDEGTTD